MEVKKEFDNKLLGRKEVLVSLQSEGPTINRNSVREQLSKKYKKDKTLVIINSINSEYGSLNVLVDANIYEKKETVAKLTAKHLQERNKIEEVVVEESTQQAPVEEAAKEE